MPRLLRPLTILRLLIPVLTCLLFIKFVRYSLPPPHPVISNPWFSPHSGWYNRSTLVANLANIHFNTTGFHIISTISSWGSTHFIAAIFAPGYCITPTAILRLREDDFQHFFYLGRQAEEMELDHDRYSMCRSISDASTFRAEIRSTSRGVIQGYEAYAFSKDYICKGADELPDVLRDLFGLLHRDEIGILNSTGYEFAKLRWQVDAVVRERVRIRREEWMSGYKRGRKEPRLWRIWRWLWN